ncbi:hypothetical protein G6011_10872 [Alternaria panax]|uniref:Uncharacterized protein n=1 Tax=Alternaria panax TaxID=48097 RepID=A0AAD4ICH5_9PLEO|nr:hypothetical protein G6011_10872 [Alternaria panax]
MTTRYRLKRIDEDLKSLVQYQAVCERLQDYRQLVWFACATTSLLTTRHLLVERNLHYPLELFISQIAATAVVAIFSHPWSSNVQEVSEQEQHRKRPVQGALLMAASNGLQAVSAFCIVQAVLHTSNLPLLCMITTIAFFTEGLVLYVFNYTSRSVIEVLSLSLLLPACAGILFMEYRLMVPSLIASILAMLLVGAASALRKLVAKHYLGDYATRSTDAFWLVGTGSLLAFVCAVSNWPVEQWDSFDVSSLPLRTLNAFSTAGAFLIGGSILFPLDMQPGSQLPGSGFAATQCVRSVTTILAMMAITGCSTVLSLRRSYISWYQLSCFLFAIICVCGKDVYNAIWKQAVHRNDARGSYDLVSRSPRAQLDDAEECRTRSQRTLRPRSQGHGLRSSLVSLALIMLWTAFISFNFGQRQYPRMEPHLDLQYESIGPLEVVISMYKERAEDVAALIAKLESMPQMSQALITIYLKDSEADERQIKQETNAHEVIKLPNVGREAETYLNHIVNRWDSLAERTVFLQAGVHNPREFYPFFERYFRANQTGFFNLGWSGILCSSDDCGDKRGWQDETSLFSNIQSRIDNSPRENVLLSYKGQFVVTAARIRGIDKAIYDELWQLFIDENSWAHQEPYLQGRPDSMSQPWFGYATERIWNVLSQCSDMDVAWRCPTLLSGWRPGGSIADCQCFDSELVEQKRSHE